MTTNNGFIISLKDSKTLDPFTWYRVHVEGIEDLCNNAMSGAYEWEFQTNDSVPGINSWYPTGENVCPDTNVAIVFNTTMYRQTVTMTVNESDETGQVVNEYSFSINPKDFGEPYEKRIPETGSLIGYFKVFDTDDINNFKTFIFEPANDLLKENTNYSIGVETDLVVNIQGDTLEKFWNFDITTMENCECQPFIYDLDPEQGAPAECITIEGDCFTGTINHLASLNSVKFNSTNSEILNNGSDYIVTTVPDNFENGDRPDIKVKIKYNQTNNQFTSNGYEFFVNSDIASDKPCLLNLNPDEGRAGQTDVNLSGIRFSEETINSDVIFYKNQSSIYSNWSDEFIEAATVPQNAQEGSVKVKNANGESNGLLFTMLADISLQVLEKQTCLDSRQSPTPWPQSQNICKNAGIGATFNKKVKSITDNTVVIRRCNSAAQGQSFSSQACKNSSPIVGDIEISNSEKEFIFKPDNLLQENYWYQVRLKSGENGIKSVIENSQL